MTSHEIGNMLVYAARYAHHRQTGAANQVVQTIIKHWAALDLRTQKQLVRETKESTYNAEDWQRLVLFAESQGIRLDD